MSAIERTKTTLYFGGGPALVAVDLATQRLTSWKARCKRPAAKCPLFFPRTPDYVQDIDVKGSVVYVAADYEFAALNVTTGDVMEWDAHPQIGSHGGAHGIVAFESTVYLSGSEMSRVGGAKRCELAAVSAGSARVTRWNPCPNDGVGDMNLHGNRLFISGSFTRIAGVKRRGLVAFDAASGKVTSWRPQTPGDVAMSVVYGKTVYAVGGLHQDPAENQFGLLFGLDRQTGKRRGWQIRLTGYPSVLAVNARSLVLGGWGLRAATG